MHWIKSYAFSSIGKKQFCALTGCLLIGFLVGHLSGNLLLLKSPEAFDRYADFLMNHPLLPLAEAGLAALFLAHISVGALLFYENWRARPVAYAAHKDAGGRTIGSATMPYTGFIVLAFVLTHVTTLRVMHSLRDPDGSLFAWTMEHAFKLPLMVGLYVAACLVLCVHLSHGVQSAFQTYGLRHPKYFPGVQAAGLIAAAAFGVGFGMLPVWGYFQ